MEGWIGLTGRLPYGARMARARMARARTWAQQRNIGYASAIDGERAIPAWIDPVLRRAVHPDPARRYEELSEFIYRPAPSRRAVSDHGVRSADGAQSVIILEGVIIRFGGVAVVLLVTR